MSCKRHRQTPVLKHEWWKHATWITHVARSSYSASELEKLAIFLQSVIRWFAYAVWVRLPTPYILSLRRKRRIEDNAPYRFIRGEAGHFWCYDRLYNFTQLSLLPFIVWLLMWKLMSHIIHPIELWCKFLAQKCIQVFWHSNQDRTIIIMPNWEVGI